MNILLHICCAPCAIFPIDSIRSDGHQAAGFYYNPNIHPYSEYLKRKAEADKYCKEIGFNMLSGDYDIEQYLQYIVGDDNVKDRCPVCWWLRLDVTAKKAKDNGFDAFTTTLLGSPYQDHDVIKKIGEDVALNNGLKFYYSDFRIGFKDGQDKARARGIYLQNYCGCLFSEKEKLEKKEKKVKG